MPRPQNRPPWSATQSGPYKVYDGTYVDTINYSNQLGIPTISTCSTFQILYHPHCHIHRNNKTNSLNLVLLRNLAHRHNPAHLQYHPFLHLSHVQLALPNPVLDQSHTSAKPLEPMALIWTHTGKRTETTTTTRRSMASPSPDLSDNQPSRKGWTLKDVILCHYRWQPWSINKPTIIGFESWLMVVKSIWSRQETLLRWCSPLNYC